MAMLYYKRIMANLMTLDDVPALWRTQVQGLIDKKRA